MRFASIKTDRMVLSISLPSLHLDICNTLGTILDPGKVIFGHLIFFGHFPIEIPMHLQICIFRPQGVLKSKKIQKKPTLKFNFTLKNM